jgi:hypothetical protein
MKPITRREALLWITGLSAGATAGVCGVGGLVTFLLARRGRIAPPGVTPSPWPTATLAPPPIVPRAVWGARAVNHEALNEFGYYSAENPLGWETYQGDLAKIYKTVVIHHSYPVKRDNGTMRALQDIHMDIDKWADIGYHFGVGGNGIIYAGRDINVRGANVAGYNTGTIGVVVIGDFELEMPADVQLQALQTLIIWLTATYRLTHLAGHCDFNLTTVCPGAHLRAYLDVLAQNAGLKHGTGGYVPPATPTPGATP